jgi:phage-related protein
MWQVEVLAAALAEVEALPTDLRARLQRLATMIEANGLERMREPYVKHLEHKLWEMRVNGRDGIARAIYFTASGKRVLIARAFIKKTQKTPRAEIEIALKRMKEWHDEQSK